MKMQKKYNHFTATKHRTAGLADVWLIVSGCLVLLILGISSFFILGKKEELPSVSTVAPQSKAKKEYTLESLLAVEPADAQWELDIRKTLILELAWRNPYFTTKGGQLARHKLIEFANKDGFDQRALDIARAALLHESTKGNKHAQVWVALLQIYDLTETNDNKQYAIETIKRMAEQNEPLALHVLAINLMRGVNGFSKEPEKALDYHEQSVKAGGYWSLTRLGHFYIEGNDELKIKKNVRKGIEYLERSNAKGGISALLDLSSQYFYNEELVNYDLSHKYSKKACNSLLKIGAYGCSIIAFTLSKEIKKAEFKNKELIAEFVSVVKKGWEKDKGSTESAAALTIAYSLFPKEFNVRREKILLWGERACLKSDFDFGILNSVTGKACANLADIFIQNKATSLITDVEAVEYYRRAIREGNANAHASLSQIFYTGTDNVKQNLKLFYELNSIAVEKFNYSYSMYNLALAYIDGTYVEKNHKKGIEFLKKAARLGQLNSIEGYGRSFFLLSDKPDYKQCYVWGGVAKKRQFYNATAFDSCAKKLSEAEQASLKPEIVQLDKEIKR